MTDWNWKHTQYVLAEIKAERELQHEKWGQQDHPDSSHLWGDMSPHQEAQKRANFWKEENPRRVWIGVLSWDGILLEEVYEALAEEDPVKLREELVQVAAVAVAWIEAIDRRASRDLEEELVVA